MRPSLRGALALLALLFGPAAASAGPLRPLLIRRATYSETYTFIADLEDGTYLQLTLSLTNLGPGGTKGLCRALVFPKDGPAWKASARVSREEVSFGEGPPERLAIGSCSARAGDGSWSVSVALEGGTAELAYLEPALRRSPHEAVVTVGGDRYESEVFYYRAAVRATFTLPGAVARTLEGRGYVDHSRGTVPPKSLARRFIRFRGLAGERGLLLLGRESWEGEFAPLWACVEGEPCLEYRSFQIEREGRGASTAFRIAVKGEGEPLLLRSGPLLYRDAPVEDLGLLGRLVAPLTGSPVTYVFRGEAERGDLRVPGILEVELLDE